MDWKELAIIFFYGTIRDLVDKMVPIGIPADFLLAGIGYWKQNTWWGKALLYASIAYIGSTFGTGIFAGLTKGENTTSSIPRVQLAGVRW